MDHVRRHPELLRLDALGYGVLQNDVDPAKLRAFKLPFAAGLAETGAVVEQALGLRPGRGIALLMRSFALTRGLWQSSHGCEGPAAAKAEPALAALYPEFGEELAAALTEYWRGALATV